MGIRIGAVITVVMAVAVGLVVIARERTAMAQSQRERAVLLDDRGLDERTELLDKQMRELAVRKAHIEEQMRKLEAELQAFNELAARPRRPEGPLVGGRPVQRVDDTPKLDVPRPTLQAAKLPRYEYKVFTIPDRDGEANELLAKMSDNGWDYVGVVQPQTGLAMQNGVQVHLGARLIFKRVRK